MHVLNRKIKAKSTEGPTIDSGDDAAFKDSLMRNASCRCMMLAIIMQYIYPADDSGIMMHEPHYAYDSAIMIQVARLERQLP